MWVMWREHTKMMFSVSVLFLLMVIESFALRASLNYPGDFTQETKEDCGSVDLQFSAEKTKEFIENDCIQEETFLSCCEPLYYSYKLSGIYKVMDVPVYCDMETEDNGGWMVIMRRSRNLQLDKFDKEWKYFKRAGGFGALDFDHWIGLQLIHQLTKEYDTELRIDLWNTHKDEHEVLKYLKFEVEGADSNYRLKIGEYVGPLAKNGLNYHNNTEFSTRDNDNSSSDINCAEFFGGGWWYRDCYNVLPTGKVIQWGSGDYDAIEMKIRPRECQLHQFN